MLPRWRREQGGLAYSSGREGRELGTQRLGHCSVVPAQPSSLLLSEPSPLPGGKRGAELPLCPWRLCS